MEKQSKEEWLKIAKEQIDIESGAGEWDEWDINHPDFEEWLEQEGINPDDPE